MNDTKIATVIVSETNLDRANVNGQHLAAGAYRVEMPADYDPAAVTGADILSDAALSIVAGVTRRELGNMVGRAKRNQIRRAERANRE